MKIGDELPVQVAGHTVGTARIEEIDGGVAYIVVPATRFKMKVKMTLEPITPETDRIFGGIAETKGGTESEASEEANAEQPEAAVDNE